jgi:hypothetical protein
VDDILPGGHYVMKGTRLSYEPFVMGRLEQFWGKDAAEYNPDRWLSLPNLPTAYEFPQFQAGPRQCNFYENVFKKKKLTKQKVLVKVWQNLKLLYLLPF